MRILLPILLVAAAACGADDSGLLCAPDGTCTCEQDECSLNSVPCEQDDGCDVSCSGDVRCAGSCREGCRAILCESGATCNVTVGEGGLVSCSGASTFCWVTCTGTCGLNCSNATCNLRCGSGDYTLVGQSGSC